MERNGPTPQGDRPKKEEGCGKKGTGTVEKPSRIEVFALVWFLLPVR